MGVSLPLPLHPDVARGQIPARCDDDRALDHLAGPKYPPRQFDIEPACGTTGDLFQHPDVGRGVFHAGDHGEFGGFLDIDTSTLHDQTARPAGDLR